MAKSNRRRKVDRAKRQSAAAQRDAGAQRRRAAAESDRAAERRRELLRSADAPVDEVVDALRAHFESQLQCVAFATHYLSQGRSPQGVLEVAEALRGLEMAEEGFRSLFGLAFHAQACHLTGDHAEARRLMDEAFARAEDDADLQLELTCRLHHLGRAVDVVNFFAARPHLVEYEQDGSAVHRFALERAAKDMAERSPDEVCPCGLGKLWGACCGPRTAEALAGFADRSGMHALRAAVEDYLPGSAYMKPFAEHVNTWLDTATRDSWDAAAPDGLELMAYENALLLARARVGDDDPEDNVLAAVAADPATPPQVAARAEGWLRARYGLWQVIDPTPEPGIECMDVCTGHEFYLSLAPEQAVGLPRWAVLLGPIVPLEGAWRAGAMMQLAPDEADALCGTVQAATEAVVAEALGSPRKALEPPPFGRAEPHTVYAYLDDSADPEVAPLIGHVLANLAARLVAEVRAHRATPPGLANTDGEPVCLLTARIAVRDAKTLAGRLEAHADFEPGPDEDGRFLWLGKEVPAAQRESMLAELRAQLLAEGHAEPDVALGDEPQRWARGRLLLRGSEITAEVNSRERLAALLDALAEMGGEPAVVEQTRVDPREDLPWSGGHRVLDSGLHAPAAEGWERQWLDESVPALHGRTPREAAAGPGRELLEALLRRFEYDADVLTASGQRGVDTAWLRGQLGMDEF